MPKSFGHSFSNTTKASIPAKRSAFAEGLYRFAGALVARSRRYSADPLEVDEFLRKGLVASMAGDHLGALLIFSTLLVPLFKCEIDVGQEEILSDALTADLNDCGLRYILAIYLTAPPADRADSVFEAVELVDEELSGLELISALEKLAGSGGVPASLARDPRKVRRTPWLPRQPLPPRSGIADGRTARNRGRPLDQQLGRSSRLFLVVVSLSVRRYLPLLP